MGCSAEQAFAAYSERMSESSGPQYSADAETPHAVTIEPPATAARLVTTTLLDLFICPDLYLRRGKRGVPSLNPAAAAK